MFKNISYLSLKLANITLIILLLFVFATNAYTMPNVEIAFSDVKFSDSKDGFTKIKKYKGKIIIMFFGYTNCPDICPTTMLDIAKSLKDLKTNADKIQPIFISVDYKRDTADSVREYAHYFDKKIVGLTSDKKNIDKITKYFKTSYALLDSDGKSKNYLVEHSSNVYIIDDDLVVKRIIPNGLPYGEIVKAIKNELD